jgi:carbonic anhydrase
LRQPLFRAALRGLLKENDMSNLDSMLERNKVFAAQQETAGTLLPSLAETAPLVKAMIIGCADMRVDPALLLGLEPGEALVLRNIGGRIVPGLLAQMGMLGRIGAVMGQKLASGGEFHLVVLHHTDCGITRLTAMLAQFFAVGEEQLAAKAVSDPRAAVVVDVALLRGVPTLPAGWLVSGLVYDVATGLVEVVVPPAPLRAS